jgi:uncharacterized protein (TIGR02117 family)
MAVPPKKYLSRIMVFTSRLMAGLVIFVLLYFIAAFSLSKIAVNDHYTSPENGGIEIYLLTNGVHTDIALPVKNQWKDWNEFLPYSNIGSKDSTMNFAAFGWGDKGFYLHTPTWADLKVSTAFKASFWLSTSAMHVSYYHQLSESEKCRKIVVDADTYQKLTTYIEDSFIKSQDDGSLHIKGHSYWQNDAFYEAKRTYSLFYTCNTWTNQALQFSGLKACFWTPFDTGIFNMYK